jgi:hypothetical protein
MTCVQKNSTCKTFFKEAKMAELMLWKATFPLEDITNQHEMSKDILRYLFCLCQEHSSGSLLIGQHPVPEDL